MVKKLSNLKYRRYMRKQFEWDFEQQPQLTKEQIQHIKEQNPYFFKELDEHDKA